MGIVWIMKYVVPEIAELVDEGEEEKDDKKVSGNIGKEIKDENLQELINDNLVNYN